MSQGFVQSLHKLITSYGIPLCRNFELLNCLQVVKETLRSASSLICVH